MALNPSQQGSAHHFCLGFFFLADMEINNRRFRRVSNVLVHANS
jgi:hypothetical protein